jgi:hypothetical protein
MMDGFFATLKARDPLLGRMRSYRLEAGTDLFGAWLVDVMYGRISVRGRRIRYVVENAAPISKEALVSAIHGAYVTDPAAPHDQ